MSEPATDVSVMVEYSMDKWFIDRVPWALWTCVAGLVVVLHADSRGGNGAVLAFVYLALLGVAFAGFASTTLIERSGISFLVEFPIHMLIFIVVAFIIAIVIAVIGGSPVRWPARPARRFWALVDRRLPAAGHPVPCATRWHDRCRAARPWRRIGPRFSCVGHPGVLYRMPSEVYI